MSKDVEFQLRAALRPVAPSDEFSRKLLAQLTSQGSASHSRLRFAAGLRPRTRWLTASLAAAVMLAVGVHQHLQQQRERESGLEARREVMQALRVTSQKLNVAYEAVKSQSTALTDEQSGA